MRSAMMIDARDHIAARPAEAGSSPAALMAALKEPKRAEATAALGRAREDVKSAARGTLPWSPWKARRAARTSSALQ